jgi:serine protease Do
MLNMKNYKVMKARNVLLMFAGMVLTAVLTVFVYSNVKKPIPTKIVEVYDPETAASYVNMPIAGAPASTSVDFRPAAAATVNAVVHVKTTALRDNEMSSFYEYFFGITPDDNPQPVMGSGSGVIISDDGYIVTNNHVIEGSTDITVALNDKREYSAELIGTDPNTDLALLKIEEDGLPTLKYGSSDALRPGEWVLAVGNPYNLTSTVTAGIVSAKARNINILRTNFSIESFIQTDAAVNPGNSGGALVNTQGELIGINTAIASRTGYYQGYSFAIPVTIVQKVVADLMEFGEVQRAILGVTITDITNELMESEELEGTEGVFITDITDNGAAKAAGIRPGDVVVSVNNIKVNSAAQLQEQVSKYRPSDEVDVIVKRDGDLLEYNVVLRNMDGGTEFVKTNDVIDVLGAEFEPLTAAEKRKLGISNGMRVTSVESGKFLKVGIRKGFIVTSINKKPVNSVKDIANILQSAEGGVIVEGINSYGSKSYYAFGM